MKTRIKKHLAAVLREIPGTLAAEDSECLHRLRVATRRLRNALWVFRKGLAPDECRRLRADIRELTRALGTARDIDTQIAFYRRSIETTTRKAVIVSLKDYCERLAEKRSRQQKSVRRALTRFRQERIAERIRRLPSLSLSPDKKAFGPARKRLKKLLSFDRTAAHPEKTKELHRMRIAAKRLRYTLEEFRESGHKQIARGIKEAKILQDTLGDMHNASVWRQTPGATQETARFVRHICERQIRRAYADFHAAWERQKRKGVWKGLARVLRG